MPSPPRSASSPRFRGGGLRGQSKPQLVVTINERTNERTTTGQPQRHGARVLPTVIAHSSRPPGRAPQGAAPTFHTGACAINMRAHSRHRVIRVASSYTWASGGGGVRVRRRPSGGSCGARERPSSLPASTWTSPISTWAPCPSCTRPPPWCPWPSTFADRPRTCVSTPTPRSLTRRARVWCGVAFRPPPIHLTRPFLRRSAPSADHPVQREHARPARRQARGHGRRPLLSPPVHLRRLPQYMLSCPTPSPHAGHSARAVLTIRCVRACVRASRQGVPGERGHRREGVPGALPHEQVLTPLPVVPVCS